MDKQWKTRESAETTELFNTNRAFIANTFNSGFERIKNGSEVGYNAMSHMIERNAQNRTPECPMGHTPTQGEAVSNLVGFLAGVGNTSRMM